MTSESAFTNDPPDERSKLGSGSFGITYRMRNSEDNHLYAVKRIEIKEVENNSLSMNQLSTEAHLLQNLNHPHIVRYFTSFYSQDHHYYYIVMELVDGGSLVLPIISDISPPIVQMRTWLIQTLQALQYMHNDMRVLHRDLKPDNILLTRKLQQIKIIDLGLATIAATSLNKTAVGTRYYASHEKLHSLPYDGRDDIWSVGCIWSELLTSKRMNTRGEFNFELKPLHASRRKQVIEECIAVDRALGLVVEKMLDPIQSTRYTASQCLDMLSKSASISNDTMDRNHKIDGNSNSEDIHVGEGSKEFSLNTVHCVDIAVPTATAADDYTSDPMHIITSTVVTSTVVIAEAAEDIYPSTSTLSRSILFPRYNLDSMPYLNSPQCPTVIMNKLINSCKEGDLRTIQYILTYRCYHHLLLQSDPHDSNKRTVLHYACEFGHIDIVKLLLSIGGMNVNHINEYGDTSLLWGSGSGHIEVVKVLLEYGADVNIQNEDGYTPLICASAEGHTDVVTLLLQHGADMNKYTKNQYTYTALLWACETGYVDTVSALLDYSASKMNNDNSMKGISVSHNIPVSLHNQKDIQIIQGGCNSIMMEQTTILRQKKNDNNDDNNNNNNNNDDDGENEIITTISTQDQSNSEETVVTLPLTTSSLYSTVASSTSSSSSSSSSSLLSSTSWSIKILETLYTCLISYIQEGHKSRLKQLFLQCTSHHLPISTLINQPNTRDDYKRYPIHYACEQGNIYIIKLLLEYGAELYVKDRSQCTPLIWATRNGHIAVVQYILTHISLNQMLLNHIDSSGHSALIYAIMKCHIPLIQLLIQYGADIHIRLHNNRTILMLATEYTNINMIKILLHIPNININAIDTNGDSALLHVIRDGNIDMVKLLIEYNADIHIQNKHGLNALIFACRYHHEALVDYFIQLGANVNIQTMTGWTALIWACNQDCYNSVLHLLHAGADIMVCTQEGYTALILACRKGNADIVSSLLSHPMMMTSADHINIQDQDGCTALHYACEEGYMEIVTVLLQQGSHVNILDKYQSTALMKACQRKHISIVRLLLEYHANTDMLDCNGKSAISYVTRYKYPELYTLLVNHNRNNELG